MGVEVPIQPHEIAIVMPQLGRLQQAHSNAIRMSLLAGFPHRVFIMHPPEETEYWSNAKFPDGVSIACIDCGDKVTFFEKLNLFLDTFPHERLVYVGNDALAGKDWVGILAPYRGKTLVALNDGIQHGVIAAHGMIHRGLLAEIYEDGRFPECYGQSWADTEVTLAARLLGRYVYEPNCVLFHSHPCLIAAADDDIYKAGRDANDAKRSLWLERSTALIRKYKYHERLPDDADLKCIVDCAERDANTAGLHRELAAVV